MRPRPVPRSSGRRFSARRRSSVPPRSPSSTVEPGLSCGTPTGLRAVEATPRTPPSIWRSTCSGLSGQTSRFTRTRTSSRSPTRSWPSSWARWPTRSPRSRRPTSATAWHAAGPSGCTRAARSSATTATLERGMKPGGLDRPAQSVDVRNGSGDLKKPRRHGERSGCAHLLLHRLIFLALRGGMPRGSAAQRAIRGRDRRSL